MKFPKYLRTEQIEALEYETVSTELKVLLTRKLRDNITTDTYGEKNFDNLIIRQNELINRSRNIQGLPLYPLESDGDGFYHPAEQGWHNSEFELVFRRLNTAEFIEFVGELIQDDFFSIEEINNLLRIDGVSFRFGEGFSRSAKRCIEILGTKEIEDTLKELDRTIPSDKPHNNIRILIQRAEDCLKRNDTGGIIHACSSVFETLAKDILADPKLDTQAFGGFFEKYRKNSLLPEPLLDFMIDQYGLRSATPLAGHGSRLPPPSITIEQAVTLIEMTKAFVKTEYRLFLLSPKTKGGGTTK